nr:proprotein convertase P-domain-containing protein [Acidobacteriota bacterium]
MTRGQFPVCSSVPPSRPSRAPRRLRPSRAAAGLLALLALVAAPAAALAEGFTSPVSPAQEGLKPLGEVAAWISPPVDARRLLREDAARDGKLGTPLRIGFRMATDLSPASAGTWEDLKDGGRIWRLSLRSAGALWIVLGFDEFRLEDGATLFVYDPALKSPRSYTAADVRPHGELWTPPIEGDELVVELLWPAKLAGVEPRLHLGAVSHGYLPFGTIGRAKAEQDGIGDSGSCNIDVACPLGANWQDEKRGAVILLSGGEGFCSGSLINTTANDCRPYVLTAAHCSAGTSTVFGFNFERSACGSGDPPPPSTYTVSGATVLANYASSDFTLLEMNGSPPEEWNAYYNGWNRGTTPPNESIVIHHPRGDVKMIAYDDDPATNGSNWGPNHWRIGEYEQGTTEPGSSGSPLFDQNHHIIGQLHGGTASCTSITYDEYGKLDASWIGGGTSASRLSDWLDPNVTGQLTMDGVDGIVCAFNPTGSVSLDSATYACTDAMLITLRDDNLRGYETQNVTVTSNTETAPETVVLTAIEPGSGFFTGTFAVAPGAPVNGDGHLSVSPGDVVTVLYIDEDDGNGGVNVPVTTTALIDCAGPVISAVATQNVSGNSAQVVWTTDELSTASVTYDTAFPPTAGSAGRAVVTVNHLVQLTGLQPCTTYYYSVTSTDPAGNPTTDTNGGAYYSFRTGTNTNPTYPYAGPAVPIPDNSPTGATATISVPYFDYVAKIVVTANITHTFDGDIALTLIAPDGRTVPLSTKRGSSGDNYVGTVFDDDAATAISAGTAPFTGPFRPESPLAVLNGIASYGDWKLQVVDSASSDTGTIDGWSLTLLFPPAPCGAQVSLDADTYSCSGTSTITVRDTNVAGPTLTVRAASTTDTLGESVILTRLAAPRDTWFQGTVALTAAPASPGDGLVSVVNADTLTVTYVDADDGQGNFDVPVTDTAATDCVAPVISNVFSSDVTGNSAVIQWQTDDPATSVVHYGPAIPPALTTSAGALVAGHAVALTGLAACSNYYYSVESVDAHGNVTVDTNGGNYYLFTTLQNT